jgi:hypothetical protein
MNTSFNTALHQATPFFSLSVLKLSFTYTQLNPPFQVSFGSNGCVQETEETLKRRKFDTEVIDLGSLKLNISPKQRIIKLDFHCSKLISSETYCFRPLIH